MLRGVRILPGRNACEAVLALFGIEYPGNNLPRLPLAQCTSDQCECKYAPIGSDQFRRLNATEKLSSKPPH